MIRTACAIALLLGAVTNANAAKLVFNFEGTIQSVIDAGTVGGPAIDFTPIPVGSTFSGTYSYDVDSPVTDGGTGYRRYLQLLSSGGSVTVNGYQFDSAALGGAIVSSQEANFGFSGLSISTQPISLPDGWEVGIPTIPYFTLQFRDATPQVRSLALPSSPAEIPIATKKLIIDFQQPVTVDGVEYGERVFITATITTLEVTLDPPPPREVDIDVDPRNATNKINLNGKTPKPLEVAIFGDAGFNVLNVVPETIQIGDPILTDPETGSGQTVAPVAVRYKDMDGDGRLDLVAAFDLLDLLDFGAIDSSSKSLEFQALLYNHGIVYGSDAVAVSGAKGKGK